VVAAPKAVVAAPKAVVAAVAAPEPEAEAAEEDEGVELLPFTLEKVKYLRLGTQASNGTITWAQGDLWEKKKDGQKGDYKGCLLEDGTIDYDAEEPMFE